MSETLLAPGESEILPSSRSRTLTFRRAPRPSQERSHGADNANAGRGRLTLSNVVYALSLNPKSIPDFGIEFPKAAGRVSFLLIDLLSGLSDVA